MEREEQDAPTLPIIFARPKPAREGRKMPDFIQEVQDIATCCACLEGHRPEVRRRMLEYIMDRLGFFPRLQPKPEPAKLEAGEGGKKDA